MHYLLFYEVAEDYLSRRAQFRDEHLQKAWAASERGELVLGGALANPVDGAVLLFKGDSPEVAEKFARVDPYVTSGMVKRWYVREWTTVAGEGAAKPIKANTAPPTSKELNHSSDSESKGPILRMWRARSTVEKAAQYAQHATAKVFPKLRCIPGHRGAYLLRRPDAGAVQFVVLTLWESMDAVRKFAGEQSDKAVVEPEASAVLTSFDESVTHFQVVHGMETTAR